jgi:hypothetical protein
VRRILHAWRALALREHLAAFGCGAVIILVGLSEGTWALISITPPMLVSYMLVYGVFGVFFRLGLAAADAVGTHRWRPYILGCLGAAVACAAVAYVLRATPLGEILGLPPLEPVASAYAAFFSPLVFGLLVTLAYVRFRDHHRAAHALREAQRAAMEARRKAAELDMHAADEALDPVHVVRTLREIESLYEADARAAGARLDALTDELRAAIPRAG